MTNLEKWQNLMEVINAKEAAFIALVASDVTDTVCFVSPNGSIETLKRTGTHYSNGQYYHGKKPTNAEVSRLAEYAETQTECTRDRVFVGYEIARANHKTTGAKKLDEWLAMLTPEAAERLSAERKESCRIEEGQIAAGTHFRCGYCRKVTPTEQKVEKIIFGRARQWGQAVMTREPMTFCSGQCAFNEQCSREG
jgi:hypothetical protein